MPPLSPLAPDFFATLPAIAGVRLAVGESGIRYKNRPDLLLMEFAPGTTVAGALTRNSMAAAPVNWCRDVLASGGIRGLVVNSGNANAFTGLAGETAVRDSVQAASALLGCPAEAVLVASTGVIGQPLQTEKITALLPALHGALAGEGWEQAADSILTTDTFRKTATRTARIHGTTVTLNGIAKGSGMIAPDMATMLAFVATDAAIPAPLLQAMFSRAIDRSFNAITVDSDSSTNDAAFLFATGKATHAPVTEAAQLAAFAAQLESLLIELAQLVVRDGEGASKFITVTVTGAASDLAARRMALAIANSPLVKTAIAGEDPNWGRIVMAVGKSGEAANQPQLSIRIGDALVAVNGAVNPAYQEPPTALYMQGKEIQIVVDVAIGSGTATVWTCDLTHGYIDINADYRS